MNDFLELLVEIAQQLEVFGLDQKNLIKIIVFLSVSIVGTLLQLSKIIEDYPAVSINKLSKNLNKLLVVNICFYGMLNILIYAIFDWLNKIFAEFFFQTVIFATLTIVLILNQSKLLVNNQFNSIEEAIKSTDESIETINESIEVINEFLGGMNLNTFSPMRNLVKFLLDFYGLIYTSIYREILDICSKIEAEQTNKAKQRIKQRIIENKPKIDKLSQSYQSISSDQDKLQQICSDIEYRLALFTPQTRDDYLLKQKLEDNYKALLGEIRTSSGPSTNQTITSALIFLQELSE